MFALSQYVLLPVCMHAGLDVKMYLDGKEGKYKDLALLSQLNSHGQFDPTMDLPPGAVSETGIRNVDVHSRAHVGWIGSLQVCNMLRPPSTSGE